MRTIDELGISKTPWKVCGFGIPKSIQDCHDDFVVTVYATKHMDANARLIAAAPELYEALFDLVIYGETVLDWDAAPTHIKASVMLKIKNAKNALAKASGEEVK